MELKSDASAIEAAVSAIKSSSAIESDSDTSTASQLLDRLCCSQSSDLAQKRQVKCNPPRDGSRKGRGEIAADPKSVTSLDRVNYMYIQRSFLLRVTSGYFATLACS